MPQGNPTPPTLPQPCRCTLERACFSLGIHVCSAECFLWSGCACRLPKNNTLVWRPDLVCRWPEKWDQEKRRPHSYCWERTKDRACGSSPTYLLDGNTNCQQEDAHISCQHTSIRSPDQAKWKPHAQSCMQMPEKTIVFESDSLQNADPFTDLCFTMRSSKWAGHL